MPIQHRDIPDAQLHEPKGVNIAAQGTAYIADGAGSGSWTSPLLKGQSTAGTYKIPVLNGAGQLEWIFWPFGYGHYEHGSTGQIITNTFSKLQINGTGNASYTGNLPPEIRGTGNLWDVINNKITPIAVDDCYEVNLTLPINTETGVPTEITVQLDIGGGASPSNVITSWFAEAGKTTPYILSIPLTVFTRATFLANGGQVFIKTDSGTVTLGSPAITLVRTNKGDI
ncbi:MAG: hypothetical protein AAFN81_08280 [Bacteroidota bacterium]